MSAPVVVAAYLFPNGMVAAFDAAGMQVSEYQGRAEVALPKLAADFPDVIVKGSVWSDASPIAQAKEDAKLTAEQLIAIVDEAAAEYEAAFLPAYASASRKSMEAFKRAVDEGMPEELAVVALTRFMAKVNETSVRLEKILDEIGTELGIE